MSEVAGILLGGTTRLVTLIGVGGAGKTTVATHVAAAVAAELPDGAWTLDLVAGAADSIAHAVAIALGLADQRLEPADVLEEFLAARAGLLVLDNCEHVVDEVAALLTHLLARAPDLRVLATSRVPIRVSGERLYPVPPLAVPPAGVSSVAELTGVPSVELFVDRAAATSPGFTLTDGRAAAVADICRRLEGIPLALEVAAGNLIALSVEEVRARVVAGDESPVGLRGRHQHQRTVESTLDWSIGLLERPEQTLLRRLAVFAGGWAADAVAPVCAADADLPDPVGSLVTLVEHSLVVRVGDAGATRYRLLEPVRQYVLRLLEESGEGDAVAAAHAGHFAGVATTRRSGSAFLAPEDVVRIRADEENCLAALRWCCVSGAVDLLPALALGLGEYWRIRGLLRVGLAQYAAAVAASPEDAGLREAAVLASSNAARLLGDAARATETAEEAHALAVELEDRPGQWTALGMLGDARAQAGDLVGAREAYDRALPLLTGPEAHVATAFYWANTGDFAARDGDLAEAGQRLDRARTLFEDGPRMWFAGRVLVQQGAVARRRGDLARAEGLVIEGLRRLLPYGAVVEAAPSLEELGHVEAARGLPELAALLLGAASALREDLALAAPTQERSAVERLVDRVRSELGRDRFARAWAAGRGTDLAGAIAAAERRSLPTPSAPRAARTALTPREQQVAELVAEGLTNRAVAERLGMAPGTARIHVERILAKLGLTSRVQVATWVVGSSRLEDA